MPGCRPRTSTPSFPEMPARTATTRTATIPAVWAGSPIRRPAALIPATQARQTNRTSPANPVLRLSPAAKSDYAWTPPNRRHIARGLYLPSLRSETLGPVVVGVDTSGSIDDATLAAFAAEISAILED